MACFRTNRNVATWLAFFALACQLSFSFGHVHVGRLGGGPATPSGVQTTDAVDDAPPFSPHNNAAAHLCAVCANISLAGSLILPILAFILAPGSFADLLRGPSAAREPASFGHPSFRARGPPHA
jgi:hypothetical protein